MKQNFQLILDTKINEISKQGIHPKLLLHCCCAPCSSYVLEYLSQYFDITCYYYNPNISPIEEYNKRAKELTSFIEKFPGSYSIKAVIEEYDPRPFEIISQGKEKLEEGGLRCFECYQIRLSASANYAHRMEFDYFTTTLSISPHKNADKLNEIGRDLSEKYGVPYLYSDFKKRGGYLRSCQLSEQYGLYRQDYCGCIFSKEAAERRKQNK